MKKQGIIFVMASCICFALYAQNVQWAHRIHSFSSQLSPDFYGATQILGKPNAYADGEIDPRAWLPLKSGRIEFVKMTFAQPLKARQIAVVESHHPGLLRHVYLYDTSGREERIYTFSLSPTDVSSRTLRIYIAPTTYPVEAIKLEFDGRGYPRYFSVDAVAISDSYRPIAPSKETPLVGPFQAERLDDYVNSRADELNPRLSPDGQRLYFCRAKDPVNMGGIADKSDIWYSQKDALGRWGPAQHIGPPINNGHANVAIGVLSDKGEQATELLALEGVNGQKGSIGIAQQPRKGSGWKTPKILMTNYFKRLNLQADHIVLDRSKNMFISASHPDGEGGKDIYVSLFNAEGRWSTPIHTGLQINGADDEIAAFFDPDIGVLYFSSNREGGYGGSDIYMTRRLDSTWTRWSAPQNVGPAINTAFNEKSFCMDQGEGYAYYTRENEATGDIDIYRIKMPLEMVLDSLFAAEGTPPPSFEDDARPLRKPF